MKKLGAFIPLAVALLFTTVAQAQLGGFGKSLGKVTEESLKGDVIGGMDFFINAAGHYGNALFPKEEAAKHKAELDALRGKPNSSAFAAATDKFKVRGDELLKAGTALSAEAKGNIKKGDAEFAKGVIKWAALGGSLALAAKDGGKDTALLAAIPVAQQAVKDLPQIKKMSDVMSALNKIK